MPANNVQPAPFAAAARAAPRFLLLSFAFDFNVEPGVAVVIQEQQLLNGLQGTAVIGEVWIPRASSTPAVCRKLAADWGNHAGPVRIYADATGGALDRRVWLAAIWTSLGLN
jgi:hypothetical protein